MTENALYSFVTIGILIDNFLIISHEIIFVFWVV